MDDYSPRLHVIYAGRGDAMYIEWTDKTKKKHLVLLDGGPLKYKAVSKDTDRFDGNSAPYSKYLFAAGQRIWKTRFSDKDKFEPNAIINSHPHDDHLEGLLAFLRFGIKKMKDDFHFKGYFYQPKCVSSSGLTSTRKQLHYGFGWKEGTGFQYEGIQVDFPTTAASILNWNSKPPPITIPPYDPDVSKENLQSILMRADPDKMEIPGKMYLTGDSVGWRIMEKLKQTPPPKLSIYKIQHHGSLKNTQIQDYCNRIECEVGYEAVVRGWLRCFVSKESHRWDPTATGPLKIIAIIKDEFPKLKEKELLEAYTIRLDAHHMRSIGKCMTVRPGEEQMKEIRGLHPAPSEIYTAVQRVIKKLKATDPAYASFYRSNRKPQEWWKQSIDFNTYRKEYLKYTMVGQIKNFFSEFVADAYVISANHSYDHPSPQTILGLAMAIKDQIEGKVRTKGGILYVTDGSAINLEGLEGLAKDWGAKWPDVVRGPLTIRVLKNRCFMSLDAR